LTQCQVREFAAVTILYMRGLQGISLLQADAGVEHETHRAGLLFVSECRTVAQQMTWLRDNGYTRKEHSLEALFTDITKYTLAQRYRGQDIITLRDGSREVDLFGMMMFSRKLQSALSDDITHSMGDAAVHAASGISNG